MNVKNIFVDISNNSLHDEPWSVSVKEDPEPYAETLQHTIDPQVAEALTPGSNHSQVKIIFSLPPKKRFAAKWRHQVFCETLIAFLKDTRPITKHLSQPDDIADGGQRQANHASVEMKSCQDRMIELERKAAGPDCADLTLCEAFVLTQHNKAVKAVRRTKSYTLRFVCMFCIAFMDEPRSFKYQSGLRDHYKAHLQWREICETCGKPFAKLQHLRAHLKIAH